MYPDRDPDLLQRALDAIEEQVLILGHIHQPGIYLRGWQAGCECGALSNNLMGKSQISYASLVWDGEAWQPTIHTLQPNYEAIKTSFVETGFYDAAYPFSRAFLGKHPNR